MIIYITFCSVLHHITTHKHTMFDKQSAEIAALWRMWSIGLWLSDVAGCRPFGYSIRGNERACVLYYHRHHTRSNKPIYCPYRYIYSTRIYCIQSYPTCRVPAPSMMQQNILKKLKITIDKLSMLWYIIIVSRAGQHSTGQGLRR